MFDANLARVSRGLTASAALCAGLLLPGRACAQDPHPTLLAYKAPADCPAVGDFQRSVERRSTRIHFVDEGTHDRELSIVLHKDGDYTVGELRLIEASGGLRQRSVRFTTCAEAVEGLALIATVSLDPQVLLAAPKPVPETPPSGAPAPEPRPSPPRPRPSPPADHTPALGLGIGAELNAYFNALKRAGLGGSLFLDAGSLSGHLFAPTIHVLITHVEQVGPLETAANANFTLTLLGLRACPLRIGGDVLVFRPCAAISGGGLHTTSEEATARFRPYVSWGGTGLLSIRLGELVEIVGDAGVGVPVIRDTFWFGNCDGRGNGSACTRIWKTPALYMSTGLGFRLRLP